MAPLLRITMSQAVCVAAPDECFDQIHKAVENPVLQLRGQGDIVGDMDRRQSSVMGGVFRSKSVTPDPATTSTLANKNAMFVRNGFQELDQSCRGLDDDTRDNFAPHGSLAKQ